MYTGNFRLFLTIGLIFIPISIVVAGLQAGLFLLTDLDALDNSVGTSNPVVASFVLGMSLIFTLLGLAIVQGVVAYAMGEVGAGRPVTARAAYRAILERRRSLFRVIVVVAVIASSLTLTFFLMPVAIWILVRWSLVAQVGVIEDRSARDALRRSSQLVRRHWLRTLLTVVGVALIALVSGPFIGALALLGTDTAFWVANLIAAIIYVFALPFVAVVTTFCRPSWTTPARVANT